MHHRMTSAAAVNAAALGNNEKTDELNEIEFVSDGGLMDFIKQAEGSQKEKKREREVRSGSWCGVPQRSEPENES